MINPMVMIAMIKYLISVGFVNWAAPLQLSSCLSGIMIKLSANSLISSHSLLTASSSSSYHDHLACVDSVPMDAALEEPRTTVTAEKSKLLSKISHIAIFQKRSPVNTIMLPRAAVSTNLRI